MIAMEPHRGPGAGHTPHERKGHKVGKRVNDVEELRYES
jgi:hypothetical protein